MSAKTKDILSSLHSYKKAAKEVEKIQNNHPVVITGTNPLQHKAMINMIGELQNLVEVTASNTWMDVIPETLYADLATQISATPKNGITKNTNTGDVVMKDHAADYIVLSGTPWAARYTETVSATANVAFTVNHMLGTEDVVVMVKNAVTKEVVSVDITILDANSIEVTSTEDLDLRITCI